MNALDFNDTNSPGGVTFKPIAGAAIFWRNLDATGKGFKEVVHAGLPVKSGHKSAVNIWNAQTPIKGDSWSGIVCLDGKGETYDCAWDDPKAKSGISIQYGRNYWLEECEALKNLLSQRDQLSAQFKALENEKGSEIEKLDLRDQILQIEEAFSEGKTALESVLNSSTEKQIELENLIH